MIKRFPQARLPPRVIVTRRPLHWLSPLAVVALCIMIPATSFSQLYYEAPGSPYAVGGFPESIAVTPNGSYLYVNNASANTISGFVIAADGTLSPIAGSPFAADANAIRLATDGRFFCVANGTSSNTISVFSIGTGGVLFDDVPGSPFASGGSAPQNLAFTSSYEHLVVTNAATDDFDVFVIDPISGVLTAVAGSPFSAGDEPQGMAISSTTNRLAIGNCVGDSISVYDLDPATGIPTPVTAPPLTGIDCPLRLAFDASDSYLYVDALNSFNGFSIAGNGALTELSSSPYIQPGYTSDQGLALSAGGSRVFTTGRDFATSTSSRKFVE